MKNDATVICQKCYDTIAKRSEHAAELWQQACVIAMNSEESLMIKDCRQLKILEQMGFIRTTDLFDYEYVSVNILGLDKPYLKKNMFCINKAHHE